MSVRILQGDVRARLAEIPDESVHCVVTSPPYWGLRDYGVEGQLGLEPTLGEHLDALVAVFRDVRRVLRKDGTAWVNYGDCYATSPNGRSAADTKAAGNDDRTFRDKPFSTIGPIYRGKRMARGAGRWGGGNAPARGVLKPKDLCMVANRLAIALQDDGWWVRSEIIWHKPNPMPESIKDRPGSSHEKVWLLSRSERYWYDADAVAEPSVYGGSGRKSVARGGFAGKTGGDAFRAITDDRNLRTVWTIPAAPFPEAHFATFPPALVDLCIKAGCPKGGTVLDPFLGAGTTALVADGLGRDCIGIELNPAYVEIAERRIANSAPMFAAPLTVERQPDLLAAE